MKGVIGGTLRRGTDIGDIANEESVGIVDIEEIDRGIEGGNMEGWA